MVETVLWKSLTLATSKFAFFVKSNNMLSRLGLGLLHAKDILYVTLRNTTKHSEAEFYGIPNHTKHILSLHQYDKLKFK